MKAKDILPVLLTMLFAFFFLACNHKTNENSITKTEVEGEAESSLFFTIDFSEIIKHKQNVNLSEIAQSVEYVALENNNIPCSEIFMMYN